MVIEAAPVVPNNEDHGVLPRVVADLVDALVLPTALMMSATQSAPSSVLLRDRFRWAPDGRTKLPLGIVQVTFGKAHDGGSCPCPGGGGAVMPVPPWGTSMKNFSEGFTTFAVKPKLFPQSYGKSPAAQPWP